MARKTANTLPEKKRALSFFRAGNYQEAADAYARLCKRDPKDHDGWLMRGLSAQRLGDYDIAIRYIKHAITLNPRSAKLHDKLGSAYLEKGYIDLSIKHFREALRIKSDYSVAHDNLTKALLAACRYHEAASACQEALHVLPESAEILCRLAVALEQNHQLESALMAAKKALQAEPGHIRASYTLARLDKRSGNLGAAQIRLQSLKQLKLPPVHAASITAELGDVLDRLGNYSQAYEQYVASNKYIAETITPEQAARVSVYQRINKLRTIFTDQFVEGWNDENLASKYRTPVFLVGFPRSGTTLTEQVIGSLEAIVTSDEKPFISRLISETPVLLERPFQYPHDLANLSPGEIGRLRARYWELVEGMLGNVEENAQLLDKLPLNLIDLGFIYRLFPGASVIVVIRDPRDCCMSCFMQPFQPNQSMVNFLTLENSARFYAAVMNLWLHYRSVLKLRFYELRYEELVGNFEAEARRLVEFTGEAWDDRVLRYYEHAGDRDISTPSYSAVVSPVHSGAIGRWQHYEAQMEQAMHDLKPYVEKFGYE
ncbi:MAG: sulfotransferase [Gammaproteobacteria bacterium]